MNYILVHVDPQGVPSFSITEDPDAPEGLTLRPGEIAFTVKTEAFSARHSHQVPHHIPERNLHHVHPIPPHT